MSLKDYLRAVETIKSAHWVRNDNERELLTETFVEFFQDDNPRFNPDKFREACKK